MVSSIANFLRKLLKIITKGTNTVTHSTILITELAFFCSHHVLLIRADVYCNLNHDVTVFFYDQDLLTTPSLNIDNKDSMNYFDPDSVLKNTDPDLFNRFVLLHFNFFYYYFKREFDV